MLLGQAPDPEHARQAGERLRELSAQLKLTDEQKEKLRPILLEEAPELKALRDDTSMPRREKAARLREVIQETEGRVKPILTPHQVKKLEKVREDAIRKRLGSRGRM